MKRFVACCMLFTIGKPHSSDKLTFFGFYKEDGFKKKKNLGRVEQYDDQNNSIWKNIEKEWITLYRTGQIVDGKSAIAHISSNDEWLCEAYMKSDFGNLSKSDFIKTYNNYISYLAKEGNIWSF